MLRSAAAIGPTGAPSRVGVAAGRRCSRSRVTTVVAVGPADDRPDPGGGPAGPAFAVQLDHHIRAQMAYSSSWRTHACSSRRPLAGGEGARIGLPAHPPLRHAKVPLVAASGIAGRVLTTFAGMPRVWPSRWSGRGRHSGGRVGQWSLAGGWGVCPGGVGRLTADRPDKS
jgi:hypothetical protein